MSNSKLVDYVKISPNNSGKRTKKIDRITPHCVVGQCSVETLGNIFADAKKRASSNYGIGYNGRIGMYVPENMRSWCSSSRANDQRAVTIECASDSKSPYAMNKNVYKSLVALCVDICRRNGKTKFLWFADENKTLRYKPDADEMIITVHRWFANKSCPGDWLYSRLDDLAVEVTKKLQTIPMKKTINIKIGDVVRIASNATIYNSRKKFSPWVYYTDLFIRDINENRIVISTEKTGAVTGAVHRKYIIK